MITLELPFPPSVNTYWRSITIKGRPRVLISKNGRDYRRAILETCLVLNPGKLSGPLSATVDLYPPCNRRRDVDNYNKGLFDALGEAGLYEDDSQIIDLRIRMHPKKPPGCVVVTLRETSDIQTAHAQLGLVS